MNKHELAKLQMDIEELEDIGAELEFSELVRRVNTVESELKQLDDSYGGEQNPLCQKLLKRTQQIKQDNDFYDEETMYDIMFPNRHDDDFDEEQMSYRSVFGDD